MISDPAIKRYLMESRIPLRLACVTASGWPIVLSLWYLFEGGKLYCATPQEARVVDYLLNDPRCGFEVASDQPPYCGIRGQAKADIDEDRGLEILARLLERYLGDQDNPLAQRLLSRRQPEVAIRLEPVNYHTWNFSDRMADSLPELSQKPCPD